MADLFPGAQTIIYTQKETTYGTARSASGGRSMYSLSDDLQGAEERENRPDRSGQADHTERYVGRKSATWEVSRLVLPNGSAGTQPDDAHLWEAHFGNVRVTGTAVEYTHATLHNTSLTIRRGVRSGTGISGAADLQDHVTGAIASRMEITWGAQGNNGLAQVVFGGDAKQYGHTGNSTLNLDGGAGATLGLTTAAATLNNAKHFSEDSLVLIDDDTGGGSGILIETINYTNGVITYSETLDATASHGDEVRPYNPTASTSGSPIHARKGELTIDGGSSTIKHLGGRVTVEDNRTLLNEEVGTDSATQVLRSDRRNVTFSLDFLMKKDETHLLGDVRRNSQKNIKVTIGSETNKRLELMLETAEFNFTPADIPEQEVARITLEGVALAGGTNDALKARIY